MFVLFAYFSDDWLTGKFSRETFRIRKKAPAGAEACHGKRLEWYDFIDFSVG